MPDITFVTAEATDEDEEAQVPHLSVAFYPSEDYTEVDMVIGVLEDPTDAPASNALLTGLTVMALERQGYVAMALQKMFPEGRPRPTEKEATEYVRRLMADDQQQQAA